MNPNSFDVNSPANNSYDLWGIKVINRDVFSPPKRERKRAIPFRHGSYDMGYEKYFDDRQIRVECQLTRQMSKADFREIIYVLSQKNMLFFWDEPDKFYRAELYESVTVEVFPRESGRNFTLPFDCEPFAYGMQESIKLCAGINGIMYTGTAEAPTLIIIRNPNPFPISGVMVTAVQQIK